MKTFEERQQEMQKAERVRKIIALVKERILDLQVIKGGFLMTHKAFTIVLKEHPQIREELDILESRKFRLERLLFKIA